jgi:hypothetical protein
MGTLYLGQPFSSGQDHLNQWMQSALREIERTSREDADIALVAQDFMPTNFTELRSFDAGTATLGDIANVLATFINDIKKRGAKG